MHINFFLRLWIHKNKKIKKKMFDDYTLYLSIISILGKSGG